MKLALLSLLNLLSISQGQPTEKNPLVEECELALAQLYADFEDDAARHLLQNRRTMACALSPSLQQEFTPSQLLNFSSELLRCDQLPYETSHSARIKKPRAIRLGCFDPLENGLTTLSARFGPTSSRLLFLSRRHQPIWALRDLPKPEVKFKRFPTLNLRLPADFFYPFGGCSS